MFLDAKTAIVHDWMSVFSGAERVVAQITPLFSEAHVFTLFDFLTSDERAEITAGHPLTVSNLNRLPGVQHYYRYLLMNCTRAIEGFDLRPYDLVISSSAALSKGVLTGPDQPHIAYVHSPARYAWDLSPEYLESLEKGLIGGIKRALAHQMLHRFRIWDQRTGPSVDYYVANSNFIARRIKKVYRREAEVIYPPVDTSMFSLNSSPRDDYFVVASRLVPYKRVDLIVQAFTARPNLRLRVLGNGPEMNHIRKLAGPNVQFYGHLPFDVVRNQMSNARAFVSAACEDFGIAPVEAQACGTPVIALGFGGTSETVRHQKSYQEDEPTGVLFENQTVESLITAIDLFLRIEKDFNPKKIRENAERFSQDIFRTKFLNLIERVCVR